MKSISQGPFLKFRSLAVILAVGLLFGSCDTTGSQKQQDNTQVLQDVQKFKNTYSASLSHIGSHLSETGASLGNNSAVKTGLQSFMAKRFGAKSEAHTNATKAFVSHAESTPEALTPENRSSPLGDLPANVRNVVRNTDEALRASASYESFKKKLRQTRQKVLNEDWADMEKKQALAYIAVVKKSLAFLKRNRHLIADGEAALRANGPLIATSAEGEEPSWWECLSGAAGDAGELAIAGAGVGCAVGAGASAGPGCGSGAAIGAAVGAISGAASGAADHCF